MSVSLEALAMAGVDYLEVNIDLDDFEKVPAYLIVDGASNDDEKIRMDELHMREEKMKECLKELIKAILSTDPLSIEKYERQHR